MCFPYNGTLHLGGAQLPALVDYFLPPFFLLGAQLSKGECIQWESSLAPHFSPSPQCPQGPVPPIPMCTPCTRDAFY